MVLVSSIGCSLLLNLPMDGVSATSAVLLRYTTHKSVGLEYAVTVQQPFPATKTRCLLLDGDLEEQSYDFTVTSGAFQR